MGGGRLAVRILGIAATMRGFAYALTEGSGCLVDVSVHRRRPEKEIITRALREVLKNGRPLFVAFYKTVHGKRARVLDAALTAVCAEHEIMILRMTRRQLSVLTNMNAAHKWQIAQAMAYRYPEIAHKLPRRRINRESEDDNVGMLVSVAAAVAAWQLFRPPD